MKDFRLLIGKYGKYYRCAVFDLKHPKILMKGNKAFEMAKKNCEKVEVKFLDGTKEKLGNLTKDGIFEVKFDCGWKSSEKIDLNNIDFEQQPINESSSDSKKYLVILNFDSDIGILFKKKFDKKNALHLKKIEKGNLDDVLDKAYMVAQEDVENEVDYQIVVEQEGIPVVFETGIITPDLDLVVRHSEEEEDL